MEELSLADYIQILKHRRKYFLTTFTILLVCTFLFALLWSNYRSSATVEIEQAQVSPDTVIPMGMSANDMQEALADLRISKIEQKVTAPASLIEIMTKFDLYPEARHFTPMASLAKNMSEKIKLELLSSTVANPAAQAKVSAGALSAIAFTLSFDYSDPQTAQQVTNELVSRFLDEDLKERREQAQATSDFLQSQITALEDAMADQEKKISEFRQQNGGGRPENLMFNQQAAETASLTMQNLDSQIAANEGTQGTLNAQLAMVDPYSRVIADGQMLTTPTTQLKALEAQYTSLTARYGPEHPDVLKAKHQIEALRAQIGSTKKEGNAALKAQIDDTRTNLETAQKTYGPDNPDVIALQDQLKKLEAQEASAANGDTDISIKLDADNPPYLALVAQLRSVQEQHKSLVDQRTVLQAQQEKYQKAVAEDPALEQQMATLARDYDNSQLRYREMKEKKMAADMDQQMVLERKGQRLIVINPPELPVKTHPSRLMLLLAGIVLSLFGGLGSVVIVQVLSQGVLGAAHLTSLVGTPPMVTIPHIYTEEEIFRSMKRRPYAIAGICMLGLLGLITFNFVIMPLNVLWTTVLQRVGL